MSTISVLTFLFCLKGGTKLEEIWKDIKGYEGHYQISNTGKVKSLHFNIATQKQETILKQSETWGGYLRVGLTKDRKPKLFAVHRLVAEAFIPNKENNRNPKITVVLGGDGEIRTRGGLLPN